MEHRIEAPVEEQELGPGLTSKPTTSAGPVTADSFTRDCRMMDEVFTRDLVSVPTIDIIRYMQEHPVSSFQEEKETPEGELEFRPQEAWQQRFDYLHQMVKNMPHRKDVPFPDVPLADNLHASIIHSKPMGSYRRMGSIMHARCFLVLGIADQAGERTLINIGSLFMRFWIIAQRLQIGLRPLFDNANSEYGKTAKIPSGFKALCVAAIGIPEGRPGALERGFGKDLQKRRAFTDVVFKDKPGVQLQPSESRFQEALEAYRLAHTHNHEQHIYAVESMIDERPVVHFYHKTGRLWAFDSGMALAAFHCVAGHIRCRRVEHPGPKDGYEYCVSHIRE